MHITQYSDYSLRVLLYLGIKGSRATIPEISKAFRISRNHLMKVASDLVRLGHVRSFPGKAGGLELAQTPESLRIGSVLRQIEPMNLLECFDVHTNTCPIQGVCLLEGALYEARKAFLESLDRYTLADFLRPGANLNQRLKRLGLTSK